ncbi:nuclear transport factor 2 family protein [Alphaproteobacteria bacterium GH1-50]|uniref:Nuclear transport factor 2 family protein n=1 Tax=Kangsaoukella pontilimi TaxID=2691042 RepID=A0A7C9IGN7_9RHOB|nr:nuclear transport factor 2 family protein [Kangsaoukella pontilimi]MXQ08087.1 nuclear transport factor 2 family protein [Kangsaoukella pontilimi]
MDLQKAKRVVRDYYDALDSAAPDSAADVMAAHTTADFLWRGYHPWGEIGDAAEVGERFWTPLRTALTPLQRRLDIFIAGQNAIDGGATVWVASMGHLMGLFDHPWLGIRPTRKIAMLRYAAFHRVEGDRIADEAMFFDIPHLMMQAGLSPFPPQTGAHLVQPGPMPHDALLFEPRPEIEGKETLAAIDRMVTDIRDWQKGEPIETELRRSWHEDMIWWGPAGIGATYTIPRYAEQHAGPFRAAFAKRTFNGHVAKIGEGHYGGFFGWPNLTLDHGGGFMGMPGTGTGDMRVIDMYRRRGDKLVENWIFIDLLHFWKQQGVDILARTTGIDRA